MKYLKLEVKLMTIKIKNNKLKQENKELREQISIMLKNSKEREQNLKDVISIRDMYKNGYRKEHNELIKLKNDYKLLTADYDKQTRKLDRLQKKVSK